AARADGHVSGRVARTALLDLAAAVSWFRFQGRGSPRDLPAFPTRRSSDLPKRDRGWPMTRDGLKDRRSGQGDRRAADGAAEPAGDRKSTRLNSSHVSISYAVFCLKENTSHSHPRDRAFPRRLHGDTAPYVS